MRLAILDAGHRFWSKVLFAFIRVVSRQPVPDVLKLNHYRPRFLRHADEGHCPGGDARTLRLVGWRSRIDGCVRLEDERVGVLNQGTRRGRGESLSG
jgi:hypothetical protein